MVPNEGYVPYVIRVSMAVHGPITKEKSIIENFRKGELNPNFVIKARDERQFVSSLSDFESSYKIRGTENRSYFPSPELTLCLLISICPMPEKSTLQEARYFSCSFCIAFHVDSNFYSF